MPSSQYYQLNEILEIIMHLRPSSVLDIGPGFGKYGFLCREYLELWDGRNVYGDWQCRIDCIEVFEKYITPIHKEIYSTVCTGNALDLVSTLSGSYDLVLMVDVLEHFSYEEGCRLLEACREKAAHILIASPKSVNPQEEAFRNPFEKHRFEWKKAHLHKFGKASFFPHHSTLICLIGDRSDAVRGAYIKNHTRWFLKRHFRFLRLFKKLFA